MVRRVTKNRKKACINIAGDDSLLLFADGLDDAILGMAERDGINLVVYDQLAVIETLCKRDKMTKNEAEEFFAFNIAGAWMGEGTPLFLRRIDPA